MVGAGLKDGMASTEVRAGSVFIEFISGNTLTVGTSIATGEILPDHGPHSGRYLGSDSEGALGNG